MFDLIGFWTTVTILTLVITSIVWPIVSFIVGHIVFSITQDRELANKTDEWIVNGKRSYHCTYLNRISIPDPIVIPATLFSATFWVIYCLAYVGNLVKNDHIIWSVAELVSYVAIHTASFMGYVGVVLVIYFGVIFSGRELWKLKVKVDEVIKKAGD